MSVFARVLRRAAVRGSTVTVPAWPKGSTMPLRRQDDDADADAQLHRAGSPALLQRLEDDDAAQALRRQEQDDEAQALRRDEDEDGVQPLRRGERDDEASALRREEEHDEASALRRDEDEEAMQALRRNEEDGEASALRRGEDEHEDERVAQPLHRHDDVEVRSLRREDPVEEEHDQAAQPLSRSGGGDPMGAVPVEPLPDWDDTGPQDELPDMRALRRDAGVAIVGPEIASAQDPLPDGGSAIDRPFVPARFDPPGGAAWSAEPPRSHHEPPRTQPERPRVTIDQVDVVIHETAPAASTSRASLADLSRRMNARYLRRL